MASAQIPLPDHYNVHAWGMGDLMMMLRDQVGIPLSDLIDLSPQQLYDLACEFAEDVQAQSVEHLVVIDDETGEALKELIRRTVERFRPENRGVAHNVAVEARSIALSKAGLEAGAELSLTELEKRLWDVTGEPAIVLEDHDYEAYGVEMNRIISTRPHGRSRALDDDTGAFVASKPSKRKPRQADQRARRLPDQRTMSFLVATTVMTRFGHPSLDEDPDVEPTVMFMAGPVNNATARRDTAALATRTGKSVVYLEFERGKAAKGPRNIVVFEMVEGELTTWERCALWTRLDNPVTVILPRGQDFAFGNDGLGIRRMTGAPTRNLAPGFAAAKAELLAMVGRMTPEVLDQIQLVKKHVYPAGDH